MEQEDSNIINRFNLDLDISKKYHSIELLLIRPTFVTPIIKTLKQNRAKVFVSRISRDLYYDNFFIQLDKKNWQQKTLLDFGIRSVEDIHFDSVDTIPHFEKHKKDLPKLTSHDLYERSAKDFIMNFLSSSNPSNLIIPRIDKNTQKPCLKLYNTVSKKVLIIEKNDSNNFKFSTYYRNYLINRYLEVNLYRHIHSLIEHHVDMRTCGLFTNELTQDRIIKRINDAKILRNQLEQVEIQQRWIDQIIKVRGSLENLR